MNASRILLFLIALIVCVRTLGADDKPAFAPNQEWSYHSRAEDPGSTIVIGRIQDHPKLGRIIHIAIRGLNVKNPRIAGGVSKEIGHVPISESALRDSVTVLKGVVEPPQSVPVGISEWERGKGGVFTISVSQIVDVMERTLSGTPNKNN
jgi:hypothetical protein